MSVGLTSGGLRANLHSPLNMPGISGQKILVNSMNPSISNCEENPSRFTVFSAKYALPRLLAKLPRFGITLANAAGYVMTAPVIRWMFRGIAGRDYDLGGSRALYIKMTEHLNEELQPRPIRKTTVAGFFNGTLDPNIRPVVQEYLGWQQAICDMMAWVNHRRGFSSDNISTAERFGYFTGRSDCLFKEFDEDAFGEVTFEDASGLNSVENNTSFEPFVNDVAPTVDNTESVRAVSKRPIGERLDAAGFRDLRKLAEISLDEETINFDDQLEYEEVDERLPIIAAEFADILIKLGFSMADFERYVEARENNWAFMAGDDDPCLDIFFIEKGLDVKHNTLIMDWRQGRRLRTLIRNKLEEAGIK